jgi:hypothetical protein
LRATHRAVLDARCAVAAGGGRGSGRGSEDNRKADHEKAVFDRGGRRGGRDACAPRTRAAEALAEVKQRYADLGIEAGASTPAQLKARLEADIRKWARLDRAHRRSEALTSSNSRGGSRRWSTDGDGRLSGQAKARRRALR